MTTSLIKGSVEWTGDNPFIYLSGDGGRSWATLSLMFRIAWSPLGTGNVLLVLEQPSLVDERANARALCASDNLDLARDLVTRFVPHFGVFRGASALDSLDFVPGKEFSCGPESDNSYVAQCTTDEYGRIVLHWHQLRKPFAVDAPPEETATGEHIMLSVFRPADAATVAVGDQRGIGELVERDFFGGRSMSAGLAFSESWIRAT